MMGTIINIITVLVGGTLGVFFGNRLPERVMQTIVAGLGLFTAAIGLQMFFENENPIVVLGSLLIGGLLGEWWRVEARLAAVGRWLEQRFAGGEMGSGGAGEGERGGKGSILSGANAKSKAAESGENRFVKGFLTASLVFCVGPMTILGAIQDGLTGDYRLLAIKAVLDGFAGLAFAASLGAGVLFSTLVILIYQGGLSLLAAQAQAVITEPMMAEMTAVGGVLLLGLALSSLLEIKPIRVGNFLPALAVAPVIVGVLTALGVAGY